MKIHISEKKSNEQCIKVMQSSSKHMPLGSTDSKTVQKQEKQKCHQCHKMFVRLDKHIKCSAKFFESSTSSLMIHNTGESNMLLSELDDSNASKEDEMLHSQLDEIVSECNTDFKEPREKQICLACGKSFYDLNKHLKCPKKKILQTPQASDNSDAESSDASVEQNLKRRCLGSQSRSSDLENNYSGTAHSTCYVRKNQKFRARKGAKHGTSSARNLSQEFSACDVSELDVESSEDDNDIDKIQRTVKSHELQKELEQLRHKYLSDEDEFLIDPLHEELKLHVEELQKNADNVITEKLTSEIFDLVENCELIDAEQRKMTLTDEQGKRLSNLNNEAKELKLPKNWTWAAKEGTPRFKYNDERLQFCTDKEMQYKIVECKVCGSTGILTGDQIEECEDRCYFCPKNERKIGLKSREERLKIWNEKVKPSKEYPQFKGEELPELSAGEKSVINLVQPAVTVIRSFTRGTKFRQESISLLKDDPSSLWLDVLPKTDLKDRFLVIEQTKKNDKKRYIFADPLKVERWLNYLFENHPEYIFRKDNDQLKISKTALSLLENECELAGVDKIISHADSESSDEEVEGAEQTAMRSGLTESNVYCFDNENLYLRDKEFMKLKKQGKIEIIEDKSRRRPVYNSSANISFPHLYPDGKMSPLDFKDWKICEELLKRQTMFAQKTRNSTLKWRFAEDSIHLMHQFARLQEQKIHARVGFYLTQHPEASHLPIESVLNAFKNGFDEQGLLDSQLPDLSTLLTKMPNSREKWFSERLDIEAISRDLGGPNLFLTLNMDVRSWPDVRRLIFELECGKEVEFDKNWLYKDAEQYTKLIDKYAVHVSTYLCRKVKIFLNAFLHDVCGVQIPRSTSQSSNINKYSSSWFWRRVEFTEKRGVQHWHCLVKLPHVLDCSLLGRIIHNGRVIRNELKYGNIKKGAEEQAWKLIKMGLLASRYVAMFADSISTASFYTEAMDPEHHDPSKVIDVEKIRKEFVQHCKNGTLTCATHPSMRKYGDPECDDDYMEMAKVAAASCMHNCIPDACGGSKTGDGCRFNFPKKLFKYTVPAIFQVNQEQMEAQIMLKRTCSRVPNLNRHLLLHWRANHDMTVLIDAAHSMRYVTKYVSKSGKHNELLNDMVDYLRQRSVDLMPPTMKQVLSHLILADCSHRSFLTKQELSYKVMDLPEVERSFAQVKVVGFYKRANIKEALDDENVIEFSDRTPYSAYAERCNKETKYPKETTNEVKERIENMCFREFVETMNFNWKENKDNSQPIEISLKRKFKTRDIHSGYWTLSFKRKRINIRYSTILYTSPAIDYQAIDVERTDSQCTFFGLPKEKRQQLYRAYHELVCYVPWKISPDEFFRQYMTQEDMSLLEKDPEDGSRYSLRRLQAFFTVYRLKFQEGFKAKPDSCDHLEMQNYARDCLWKMDNQYSFSMFLANQHNREIHLDRLGNKGVLTAQYEPCEDLEGTEANIRPALYDELDDANYPSFMKFLSADTFREIIDQPPPNESEISVAFPLQHGWQALEDIVKENKAKLFLACPPEPTVSYDDLTDMQKFAYERMIDKNQQVVYVSGKAGSGKTAVALLAFHSNELNGRVQAAAGTGKAASNFNAPTIHGMLSWNIGEQVSKKSLQDMKLFYADTDTFIIDEVNALSASTLAKIDETMNEIFEPNKNQSVRPRFGGKKMIFIGDMAQISPVGGSSISDEPDEKVSLEDLDVQEKPTQNVSNRKGCRARKQNFISNLTAKGKLLYQNILLPNSVILKREKRSAGLLQEICDKIRNGTQDFNDLFKLTYLRRKFPEAPCDNGICYENEQCALLNWRELWDDCQSETPKQHLYICKASYENTPSNQQIVDGLSSLPSKVYNYAPDVLCIAEGCEVRLVKNINIAAGLVNGATGTVVKVIYNNANIWTADHQGVLDGKSPPPYCIILNFEGFQGFIRDKNKPNERMFPFTEQKNWVPIYREKFVPTASALPQFIRKRQQPSVCYRMQFPLDLSKHLTAHRAQGQTIANALVSVDFDLLNPDKSVPSDVGSILYVAISRVKKLEDLLVSPIPKHVWETLGKTPADLKRKKAEELLQKSAEKFCISKGKYSEFTAEMAYKPDYSCNIQEWERITSMNQPPLRKKPKFATFTGSDTFDVHFEIKVDDTLCKYPLCLHPAMSERHIGIDQGRKNFAVVVVDKIRGKPLEVVAAENYHFDLPEGFDRLHLLDALITKSDLLKWMQIGEEILLPRVDRVIVHIEVMDKKNADQYEFTIGLGKILQTRATDINTCIVKLSLAKNLRANGPIFRMGTTIVRELNLTPVSYQKTRFTKKSMAQPSDKSGVDQSSNNETTETHQATLISSRDAPETVDKKKMVASIFRYIIDADKDKEDDMAIIMNQEVRSRLKSQMISNPRMKLDDLGDAFLHALNEILCGGTNYKQLVSANPSIHSNRSVAVLVLPHATYWIVLNCTWNRFRLEDVGIYDSRLQNRFFGCEETKNIILDGMDVNLKLALTDPNGISANGTIVYNEVDHIKMIVKQVQGLKMYNLENHAAGKLQDQVYSTMKELASNACSPNSAKPVEKNDKHNGHIYYRIDVASGKKFQVIKSTGKHLNAVQVFYEWAKDHMKSCFEKRTIAVNQEEKSIFFEALKQIAFSGESSLDMLQISDFAAAKLVGTKFDRDQEKLLADLILLAINHNQQPVKGIAANYRKKSTSCVRPNRTESRHTASLETDGNEGDDEMAPPNFQATASGNETTECEPTFAKRARMTSTTYSQADMMAETNAMMIVPAICRNTTPEELLTIDQMNITIAADYEEYLRIHKLEVIPAPPDGHCLMHSFSICTGISIDEIKDIIKTEFYDHADDYTPFGITHEQMHFYLNDNQYNLNSSDAVINILATATNTTVIVIGQRYRIIDDPECEGGMRYDPIANITEFQQIKSIRPQHDVPDKFVLLLKSAAHFDAIIVKE